MSNCENKQQAIAIDYQLTSPILHKPAVMQFVSPQIHHVLAVHDRGAPCSGSHLSFDSAELSRRARRTFKTETTKSRPSKCECVKMSHAV